MSKIDRAMNKATKAKREAQAHAEAEATSLADMKVRLSNAVFTQEKEVKRKTYYTLLERGSGERWSPQFGDYSRVIVRQEMDYLIRSGSFVHGTKYKIIATDGRQASIDAAVLLENAKLELVK